MVLGTETEKLDSGESQMTEKEQQYFEIMLEQ